MLPSATAALLSVAIALTGAASASPTLRYHTNLTGDPPLERPISITLDPVSGSLCVTDNAPHTLDVFDDRGLHRFRTDRTSSLRTPSDGSLDPRGGFVCTDFDSPGTRTIRRLNFLAEPEKFEPEIPRKGWDPEHLIITRDGHYVTTDNTGLMTKHDAKTGAILWTQPVTDPDWERADQLGRPAEAVDGRIYVPHAGLGAILVFSPAGAPLPGFGTPGAKRGQLAFPVGVAFGPDDCILVLDRMRHVILIYDRERNFLNEFGSVGNRPGDFYHPLGIAAAPDGRVWVAQGFEGRIQLFRLEDQAAE